MRVAGHVRPRARCMVYKHLHEAILEVAGAELHSRPERRPLNGVVIRGIWSTPGHGRR